MHATYSRPIRTCRLRNEDCKLRNCECAGPRLQPTAPLFMARPAFTLFELILAIALSATLLMLIGAAINLYLMRIDASRTEIEEAQLARSVLAMIAEDVRATTIYQPQDISGLSQLASQNASFDVDDIDASGAFTGSAVGTGGSSSGSSSSSSSGSSSTSVTSEDTSTLAPGLNGTFQELILDVSRLPRMAELFPAVPGRPTAMSAATPRPSDVKTVRYFIRPGEQIAPEDRAAMALSPDAQARAGGLVRQTIDRSTRVMAERTANQALLETGVDLVASEVVRIEFRYFDGTAAVDAWDMREQGALPPAIEVRIWFADDSATANGAQYAASAGNLSNARMYSRTIELPLYQASSAGSSGMSMSSSSSGADEFGDTGESSSGGTDSGGFGTGGGGFDGP